MVDLHLSTPDDDAYWQQIFAEALTSTEDWVFSAKALRLATDSIARRLESAWQAIHELQPTLPADLKLHPILLMLSSYAAENYLKARIVVVNGWSAANIGKELPRPLKSHDIAELARLAGVGLNAEEEDIVDRLSVYAVWAGRYPSPRNRDELRPSIVGGNRNLATFFRGSDASVVQCLLEKLEILAVTGAMPTLERRRNAYDGLTIQERVRPWRA